MAFAFTSSGDPLVESYWDLVIPGNDITVPFMLVAHVTEPDVVLEQSHINFGIVILGESLSTTGSVIFILIYFLVLVLVLVFQLFLSFSFFPEDIIIIIISRQSDLQQGRPVTYKHAIKQY